MSVYGDNDPVLPPAPPIDANVNKKSSSKKNQKSPQEVLSDFWDKFNTKKPGKVTSIFPRSLYRSVLPFSYPAGAHSSRNAAESYEAAAKECRDKVRRIVRECQRTNEKFTDPDFDIEHDYERNCLNGLLTGIGGAGNTGDKPSDPKPSVSAWEIKESLATLAQSQMLGGSGRIPLDAGALSRVIGGDGDDYPFARGDSNWANPGSIHRVDWIFDSPQFTVNGYSSSDIKQGQNGDCWWLAAIATIAHRKDLMERVCVSRDEECGVYGFVFQRDGEWISTVIDDNLYLNESDFDYYGDIYDATGKRARRHRKEKQTGSEALCFAHCEDPNETWLPLLEKAFAKAHGDYEAISGGWPGEAVEDMTGGVTTTLESNRVLSKDKLWKELASTDGNYVFALAAMGSGWDWKRSGLALGHAYSILQAREEIDEDGNKVRLVLIRNPWGERGSSGVGEWNGAWADGSREWTPYWLQKIGHKFGDDGVFWMSFKDMLDNFSCLIHSDVHRTRLFDKEWTIVQQWTSANISWVSGYLRNKFEIEVKKAGLVVIVLTQLDDRYFCGLEGKYLFELHYLLKAVGSAPADHICRVRPVKLWKNRSVSCEVHLEPGRYEVLPKIMATVNPTGKAVEEVVKESANSNPEKLRQVGLQYDLAHAKGGIPDEDEILVKKQREAEAKEAEKKRKRKEKKKREKASKRAAEAAAKAIDAIKDLVEAGNSAVTTEKPVSDKVDGEEIKAEGGASEKVTSGASSENASAATTEAESGLPAVNVSGPPETTAVTLPQKPGAPTTTVGGATSASTAETQPEISVPPKSLTVDAANKLDTTSQRDEKKDAVKPDDSKRPADEVADDDSDSDSDDEEDAGANNAVAAGAEAEDDVPENPWNAVAVVGLRVYARDPDVTVTLQAAKTGETTALAVEESTPTASA